MNHADQKDVMGADVQRLNTHLASAQPSPTYRMMDRVAARRASGAKVTHISRLW